MEDRIFKKRPGTTDRGKDYEDLIVADLVLKLLSISHIEDFVLTSNDENFGAFDDVVVEIESTEKARQIHALQLKHVNKSRMLTANALLENRGNFSIRKYFEGFKELGNFGVPVKFVLFTNLKFDVSDGVKMELKGEGVEIKILKVAEDSLLSTSAESCCYQFETLEEEYRSFFESFYLYTNQGNVDTIKKDVVRRFEEMFCRDKNIVKDYIDFISEWSILEGKKSKLDKAFMKRVITLCLLSPSIVSLSSDGEVDKKSKLLKEAISKFNITVFHESHKDRVKHIFRDSSSELSNIEEINKIATKYQITSSYIKDIESLSDLEKSKLLWLMNKCPLIILESDVSYKAINLCQDEKFVILGSQTSKASFRNICDLDQKSDLYQKVLESFYCSLQGKEKISLKVLIEQDEKFRTIITSNELIQMVEDSFMIGGGKEMLSVPYISRFLTRNFIDVNYLQQMKADSVVVISCCNKFDQIKLHINDFSIIKIEKYLTNIENIWDDASMNNSISNSIVTSEIKERKIFISKNECSKREFEEVCRRNGSQKTYHHFRIVDGYLEWVRSLLGVKDLEQYRIEDALIDEKKFIQNNDNNIHIVCADAGMGKSMLMKSIKNHLPSTIWAILIYPKEHTLYFRQKNHDIDEFYNYILNKINKSEKSFVIHFLEILRTKSQISFIWDGLDEISEENLDTVVIIINKLSKEKFLQFVTARNRIKKTLETKLGVLARSIKPFQELEQNSYIKNRLNIDDNDDIIIKIKENIKLVCYNDILGIPLQIFMLTELFLQDIEKYRSLLNNTFSITDLYYHFIDEKCNVYYKEKAKLSTSNDVVEQMLASNKKNRLENYEKCSLQIYFKNLDIDCDKFLDEIQKGGDHFGIITEISNERIPSFVHNSYGEYFAAVYLSKNYKEMPKLTEMIFEERLKNIRFFFDLLLAKDCRAHIAVIYKNLAALVDCKDQLYQKDRAGRNPLHLVCSWAEKFKPLNIKSVNIFKRKYIIDEIGTNIVKGESAEYQKVIEFLSEHCNPFEIDEFLNLNSFSYASKLFSLLPMIILAKKYKMDICRFDNFKDIATVLYYCVKFDYDDIFDVVTKIPLIRTENNHQSLLHLAAKYNSINCLKKILSLQSFRTRISNGDINGVPPINLACQNRHIDVVRLLIETKANLNRIYEDGDTPLCIACRMGYIDMVRLLIDFKADIKIANESGATPFYLACSGGHVEIVKLLVDLQVDIDAPGTKGFTPMGIASLQGHLEVVRLLLVEYKAAVNSASEEGLTPLHMACYGGQLEIVRLLIHHEANINIADKNGLAPNLTPLHVACYQGHLELVQLLVEHGADINAANIDGFTPISIVCAKGNTEIVRYLLECGADVNKAAANGLTPIHMACQNGYPDIVRLLICSQAKVDARDRHGATALFRAAEYGFKRTVKLLIEAKANVNAADRDRMTPLHEACENGHMEVVRLLVDAGANITARNSQGYLPWISASAYGHKEIVHMLKDLQKERKNSK